MTDLISGRVSLAGFTGLAACGGFSYGKRRSHTIVLGGVGTNTTTGDVLGAGQGWAKSVLLHSDIRREFSTFFSRPDTFTLGVCNGCQFLSRLKEIIPGATTWPTFERNTSEQYEARVCMVEVHDPPGKTPSVFLHGMHGSSLPIITAHGEGKATLPVTEDATTTAESLIEDGQVPLQYVDNRLEVTERYPYNPNGSPQGIAGVRTPDGRVLAMMPHPERTILKDVASYIDRKQAEQWGDFGPWVRIFKSARKWVA